ncbi:SusC/RagA family TonB-linked outer membrane protein [Dysgonomonas sp. 216]|uniref:SusC/RagA family TonB-linked outer membrane protein n=1 Tax=Dysgonomonas sp. 216 TaxID=2302934 RepID=UPI0013D6DE58|nr:SusC/RagA family TonB-linked outer membrane protein [Dysgonomonas sp. 216]NDW17755.1 SusC/RagA family TonB-linked outer membrane protein [Dysgonomonas sp. 216]
MKQHICALLLIVTFLCSSQFIVAQQASGDIIVGNVYSKAEGGLIGVSVQEKDATNRVVSGTVTDINGDFSLKIKSRKNKLEISYMGFNKQTISIDDRKSFSIELKENTTELETVVITAKPRTKTGTIDIPARENPMAIQTLQANFEELSVSSLDEALQGQIAGLDIISNSGDVGSGSAMRLRGASSINGDVTPLIVVNDLIFDAANTDNFDFVNANQESFANLLSINVDDIESISVMKDGASTAIWGSKGANGVISIRTRRGIKGKPRVRYSYRLSGEWQPEGMKMLNGDEYTMFLKEAYYNPTHSDQASNIKELNYIQNDAVFPEWRMYDNNTDWVDAVKTTGYTHDHYVTLSGGGDKATFYVSGGYFNKTGSIIGQELERYTSRMDLNYDVSDRIKFKSEMSFTYTDEDKNYDKLLEIAYKKMPNLAIYKEDINGVSTGAYYALPQDMSEKLKDQKGLRNPVASANLAKNTVKSYRLIPTFRLEYDLLPYEERQMLRLKALVSFDIQNNSSYSFLPKELSTAVWTDGQINKVDKGSSKSRTTTGRLDITWVPKFNSEDHSLTLYADAEISGGTSSSQSSASYGLPEGVESPSTGSYVSAMKSGSGYSRGMIFRHSAHYSYKSKYSLGYNLAYQGSSRFGPNNRFGLFGGISGRWNIVDENFMKPTHSWLSMLSLRVSTAVVGNPPKHEYLHFSRYQAWGNYLGTGTVRPSTIRLNDLKWEKVWDVNLGTDFGFFDDLFTGAFNYYNKETSDLLNEKVRIPTTSGYSSLSWKNVGTVRNEGWELYFNLNRFLKIEKFHADLNLNFSNNRNTVLKLDESILKQHNGDYGFDNGTYMSRLQLGNSLGSIYGFRYKGVYQYSIDNPDLKESGYTLGSAPIARDASGNIIYDSEGNPVPIYFAYGTSNELAFQGGDAIYEDINNDGNINELDIVYLGNSYPKFNGGLGLKLTYDRLSVSVNTVFRYGNKIVNTARMNAENMHNNNNQSRAVNWRWRMEGDKTNMPRALNGAGRNFLGSDRYVEDGSFLRIRQVSLNYAIPQKFLSKFSISSASAFFTIYNLYCFTSYSGVDPEVSYGSWGVSVDNNQTPRPKSFTAGISVQF